MALVAAKCTQCGGQIEVDSTKEAGICIHCGTAFVTEKVVSNYNTYVTQNVVKNIYGREKTEADEYIERDETFLKLKEFRHADRAFTAAVAECPSNYKGWFGLAKVDTKNFTEYNTSHTQYIEKARSVASDEEKIEIEKVYAEFEKTRGEIKKAREIKMQTARMWNLQRDAENRRREIFKTFTEKNAARRKVLVWSFAITIICLVLAAIARSLFFCIPAALCAIPFFIPVRVTQMENRKFKMFISKKEQENLISEWNRLGASINAYDDELAAIEIELPDIEV